MNLVRGVAGLLRRSSVSQEGDAPQRQNRGSSSTAPATSWPEIQFSDDGDEKVLHALWEGYKASSSKAEREKSLEVFLAYFSRVYQSWAPVDSDNGEVRKGPGSGQPSSESGGVVGCRQGHPTRITVDLSQELQNLTRALTELPLASDVNEACVKPHVLEGGSRLLHVLEILTRSSHNRHIFRVSGGLHSLMALMKAAVVQYKYVASALTTKVVPTSPVGIMSSLFQNLFHDIITIVSHFINVDAVYIVEHGIAQSNASGLTGVGNISEQSVGSRRVSLDRLGSDSNSVPLMETGGLNWFVELLRIVRKLRKSSVLQDSILEQLILKTLKAGLLTNPRAQNHFRSIGGIDAVLDGLGGPSKVEIEIQPEEWYTCGEFEMQVLSLQVLREAVYRNFNSLQYLLDKGSAETFAETIFYAAFVSPSKDSQVEQTFVVDYDDNLQGWNSGVAQLCRVLCSFVAPTGDIHSFAGSLVGSYDGMSSTGSYWELAMRWITKVLLGIFQTHGSVSFFSESSPAYRLHSTTLQHYMLFVFKKMLDFFPAVLSIFREEGLWEVMFSKHFFYFEMRFGKSSTQHIVQNQEDFDSEPLRIEVISFVELVATSSNSHDNVPECQVLIEALEQCARIPTVATMIVKSLHRILQLSTDQTVHSFEKLNAMTLLSQVMDVQLQEFTKMLKISENQSNELDLIDGSNSSHLPSIRETWKQSREAVFDLFAEYLLASEEARIVSLHNTKILQVLFDLLWEGESRKFALRHILELMKLPPISESDQEAKLELCIKYLETLSQSGINGQTKDMNVVMDLLNGIQEILQIDAEYYQRLFREGECFVHIVSLLNENLSVEDGKLLSLSVLETLRHLLAGNQISKSSFRGLVGDGYNTLQTLLVNIHQKCPKEDLLNALLDMLVDGCFDISANMIIQNEEVITLFFNVLHQCSDEALQLFELSSFHRILEDSTANKTACVKAGLLSLLLDWFGKESRENLVSKLAILIETLGRHSISGKDMRMIFSLLGSPNQALKFKHQKVLLGVLQGVLREEGPTVFFEFSGKDSGIMVTSSIRWSSMKGFTFSCWMRVDTFEDADNIERLMSLFSFSTDSGKGYVAAIGKEKLVIECASQKRQLLVVKLHLQPKRWYFICIAHSSGRALSGGGTLKVYLDGCLTSTETLRYPKFQEALTRNTLGGKLPLQTSGSAPFEGLPGIYHSPFRGQFGPVYVFDDSLSYDQIKALFSAGPGYMYSFLPMEIGFLPDELSTNHMLDSKDGLASKLVFGFNAQASAGSMLFDVASNVEAASEKVTHEAQIMPGTQLCYRCLGRDNIDCVGGVGALFPLLARLDQAQGIKDLIDKDFCSTAQSFSSSNDYTAAEVIDLVTSLLDNNFAHQEYMHENKGMAIIGFLLQSVPLKHLKTETISTVMHLLRVVSRTSGIALSKYIVNEALLNILLNFSIWIHTTFSVQRCLLEELLRYGNEETALVQSVIGLPLILDLVQLFYWDQPKHRTIFGTKGQYYPVTTNEVVGERPSGEEVKKLRILLLSFAELIMRNGISILDVKVLVAYMERSEDPICLEDVLNCLLRQLGRQEFSATFVEHIQALGGCQLFLGLLKRKEERLRLLGLQIVGLLIMLIPYEKKGSWLITIASGATRAAFEQQRAERGKLDPLVKAIQSRLLPFKFTDTLCATLFDVLLGGASPKQVLQRGPSTGAQHAGSYLMKQVVSRGSLFALPQLLGVLLKFLLVCEDAQQRLEVLRDLLRLLEADPASSNAVVLEPTWQIWFFDLWSHMHNRKQQESEKSEILEAEVLEIRSIFAIIHCYCIFNLRGGWRHLERTVNFIHRYANQNMLPRFEILRYVLEDLLDSLVQAYTAENGHISQPCRDNTLYLMTLIDELLLRNVVHFLPFSNEDILEDNNPSTSNTGPESDVNKVAEAAQPANNSWRAFCQSPSSEKEEIVEDHWHICDKVWILLGYLNGKSKGDGSLSATLGQRARGLVESINIPASEIAAAVVTGGLGAVVNINPSKLIDKAVKLRGDKFPRVAFHLVLLYVYRSGLESASHCIQHFVSLLPLFLEAESEQIKNRLQLFLWCLVEAREQVGSMDNGARFHLISQLIRETVDTGKNLLAASMIDKDDSSNDSASVQGLLQQDRVLNAVKEERNFLKSVGAQRNQELESLNAELEEASSVEISQVKLLENNLQQSLVSICADENSRCAALQIANEENQQAICTQWCHLFRSLTDERGSWSRLPFPNDLQVSWKLDKTEDPWRRRFKLKRSYKHVEPSCNLETSSKLGEDSSVITEAGACSDTADQVARFFIKGLRNVSKEGVPVILEDAIEEHHTAVDEQSDDLEDIGAVLAGEKAAEEMVGGQNERVPSTSAEGEAAEEISGSYTDQVPSTSVMESNVILHSSVCVLVTSKRKLAGRLEIVGDCLHFSSEFAVEGTGGSSVFNSSGLLNYPADRTLDVHERKSVGGFRADVESKDELGGPKSDNEKEVKYRRLDNDQCRAVRRRLKGIKRHWRWDVMKVKAVHGIRYLLQYTALEIFFSSSIPPVFFNFPSQKHAKAFGMKIVSARNELSRGKGNSKEKAGTVYFVDRKLSLELAERYREQWRRHEINNFEYLMHLNTLAGRSYNDLTQYPVFPWILADYTSESLDLKSQTSFRDLSKPIGALDAKRFEVFEERYHNFSDPEIPSFYYGSHYSSLGIVLFYLLRLEPFTSLHRNLQGGKFDHADRLFHSIEGAFKNCLANTSDVKELIPEFFYMPEFLVNTNKYYMGVKQDGEKLGDVMLPGWAKGSPEEFVSKNREALESEYVSQHLHQWIDLIFGYKQRGRPAVEAANVFYHLTYEGAVDLEALEDRLQRAAVEDQIANFGQTPMQLFRKKHPRRSPPRPIQRPLYYAPASITLTTSIPGSVLSHGTVSSEKDASLIFLGMVDTMVVIVTSDLKIILRNWLNPSQAGGNFTFSSSQEPFFGIGAELSSPHKIRGLFAENIEFSYMLFHTLQARSSSYLLTCGHWDNSFRVLALSDGSVLQSNRQHKDIVSCLSVSSDNNFLVTGSHDTTVMVWSIEALSLSKKLWQKDTSASIDRSSKGEGMLFDKPRHVLCGHDDAVTCVAVSVELDLVVSGSKDCSCILHTLREGRYVRSIQNPLRTSISKIVVSQHGLMVIYSKDDLVFLLYSINGKHLASSESSGRIHCVEISNCGEFLVCGGDLGQVIVRSIYTLEIIRRYDGVSTPILSLTVTPEDCILAGTQDGSLLIYSVEMPQQKKVNILQSLRGRQS